MTEMGNFGPGKTWICPGRIVDMYKNKRRHLCTMTNAKRTDPEWVGGTF